MKCAYGPCINDIQVTWPVSHKKYCSKKCLRKAFRERHRDRLRERDRQYRIDNHDVVRGRERKSREKNRETHRAWGRNAWRRSNGLDSTETKSGECEICERFCERLCYDHDHNDGHHRGWLCNSCNMKLGWLERLGDWKTKIERYLSKSP